MTTQVEIRLGAVKCVYDANSGLRICSVHPPDIELTICQSDLPDLLAFLGQHGQSIPEAVRLEPEHSTPPDQHNVVCDGEPGKADQESASPKRLR